MGKCFALMLREGRLAWNLNHMLRDDLQSRYYAQSIYPLPDKKETRRPPKSLFHAKHMSY
ncbi:hypothetical protein DNHGIG_27070 [Collibacillus ludicampi]|uniref:Uncharacterized protein n=1 Tax=Collibacillus ludicampi TaxID=2771369 RepID=A0AAV4LHN3_9BACL|nr:hypothetical protein DNHGIG_27070 [Collibacillus ludicampi]